ncbi:BtrH N-terminal domain-containing protein [Blastococcus brunescens]|uniref:BtrH N-terminal domain-containing protein n=1 Tax=Blastococcus brunescens TaxID=1564165 RepID=A0ABZ1B683_9ACTN|nr:BtrH N-terminal domain-containing protein [Blastococcus sp. BMG 8361]WRL64894.1 BtrH N-terminal domain-containing protein [Blastococcus sp. BMG 8361]
MTSHKHLKSAVRARMARTGERYTTAHRHLTGSPAATDPGLVPGYRHFGGGRSHDSALLTHLLEAVGVTAAHDGEPLDEPMTAGLAGGIGFMYFSFSYAGHVPTMTIVPRIHPRPFLIGALERTGIRHQVSETTSAAKAARGLDAALGAGRPALVTVDRAGLGHQVWADSITGSDPYDVVVAGRHGDVALLDDDALAPIGVPVDVLASARAAHRASRHRMVVVESAGAPVDLTRAVRASIAVTVHDLTEDVMPGNFAGNFGLRGLTRWADALADRRTRTGWAQLFDSGPAFGHAMRRLHDCLTFDHSSPARCGRSTPTT